MNTGSIGYSCPNSEIKGENYFPNKRRSIGGVAEVQEFLGASGLKGVNQW